MNEGKEPVTTPLSKEEEAALRPRHRPDSTAPLSESELDELRRFLDLPGMPVNADHLTMRRLLATLNLCRAERESLIADNLTHHEAMERDSRVPASRPDGVEALESEWWRYEAAAAQLGSGQTKDQQTGAHMVWGWLRTRLAALPVPASPEAARQPEPRTSEKAAKVRALADEAWAAGGAGAGRALDRIADGWEVQPEPREDEARRITDSIAYLRERGFFVEADAPEPRERVGVIGFHRAYIDAARSEAVSAGVAEAVAEAIYDAMRENDPEGSRKPWVPGGNSLKQGEARRRARAALDTVTEDGLDVARVADAIERTRKRFAMAPGYDQMYDMVLAALDDFLRGPAAPFVVAEYRALTVKAEE